jgi:RNA polymerase sigma-70 factor (ECF subfamily)
MTALAHDDILGAAARGDDEALATVVRSYHDRVYRFGVRMCRDRYDADDAVQEAFVQLARRPAGRR